MSMSEKNIALIKSKIPPNAVVNKFIINAFVPGKFFGNDCFNAKGSKNISCTPREFYSLRWMRSLRPGSYSLQAHLRFTSGHMRNCCRFSKVLCWIDLRETNDSFVFSFIKYEGI